MTSVGNRQRRVQLSMQMSLGPLVHGMLTSGVAVFMLSTSPFEFVIRHFCWLLLVVLCVGACNSLLVFPILLSMVGPEAELVPLEHPDRISTPSPLPMRSSKRSGKSYVVQGSRSSRGSCQKSHHHHHKDLNDPSLTTITEEPQSWKSSNSSIQMPNDWTYQPREQRPASYAAPPPAYHKAAAQQHHQHQGPPTTPPPPFPTAYPPELQSIVVQPEVTVETTHSDSNTTKVTATANIKVELAMPGRAVRSYNFTS